MDLCLPTSKCLLADECQCLDATPEGQDYSIFRKDGSEASTERQEKRSIGAVKEKTKQHRLYCRGLSQAEVLVELKKWRAESKASFDEWKAESKTSFDELRTIVCSMDSKLNKALATTNLNDNVASQVRRLLTCNMCNEIMQKPCICQQCRNVIGCQECLERAHQALNEVHQENEYGPVEPMCLLCCGNSRPFQPIQMLGFEDIARAIRCQ
uniref:Uncharacterized protein n=1 Tax=Romanomermis culicivorax TaxID=13658 RepID=A0A915KH61_ROMCU